MKVEGGCERGGWGHEWGTQRWVWMGAKVAVCWGRRVQGCSSRCINFPEKVWQWEGCSKWVLLCEPCLDAGPGHSADRSLLAVSFVATAGMLRCPGLGAMLCSALASSSTGAVRYQWHRALPKLLTARAQCRDGEGAELGGGQGTRKGLALLLPGLRAGDPWEQAPQRCQVSAPVPAVPRECPVLSGAMGSSPPQHALPRPTQGFRVWLQPIR